VDVVFLFCFLVMFLLWYSSANEKKIIRNPQEMDNSYAAYEEDGVNKQNSQV
jgi:hypothetical protein